MNNLHIMNNMGTDFCEDSPFMDIDLLWNNTYPQFTECFQNTVLVVAPSVYLWLVSPILILLLYKFPLWKLIVPLRWLGIAKAALTGLLVVISVVRITHACLLYTENNESTLKADVVMQSIRLVTLLYALLLSQLARLKGCVSSGLLNVFWILEFCLKIIPFYQFIIERASLPVFLMNIFYVEFGLTTLVMILNCLAEAPLIAPTLSRDPPPEFSASFLSGITYSYMFPLLIKGAKNPLKEDDVPDLRPDLKCVEVARNFLTEWNKILNNFIRKRAQTDCSVNNAPNETTRLLSAPHVTVRYRSVSKSTPASAFKALVKTFGLDHLKSHFCIVFFVVFVFMQTIVLGQLIEFTDKSLSWFRQQWKGYVLAAVLFLCTVFLSLLLQQLFIRGTWLGIKIRSALISAIYRKALTISSVSKSQTTVGEIVNLMSVDTQRILMLCMYLWDASTGPLEIIITLVLLYLTMGPAVLAGLGTVVLLIPVNIFTMAQMSRLQNLQMEQKDKRIKITSEVITGIKLLKLYAWEPSFEDEIKKVREQELKILNKMYYYNAFGIFMWTMTSYMVSLATFATYVYVTPDHYLSPEKAFVALSLFNILRFSINLFPIVLTEMARSKVAIKRISEYLCKEDIDICSVQRDNPHQEERILIENGNFQWDPALGTCLRNVNIEIHDGQSVAIVGSVGAGKSSLLSAILGDMDKISGYIGVRGSIAYVPQEAWIQNATLKENILFGKPYDVEFYNKVIEACALKPDLSILPGGDMIEIGEKGINLSGGQKQRVSLARAVYSDADIYLLDDPLSAVDAHVGKHIFDEVLSSNGLLKDKTRILVTHGLQWLPHVDSIVVLAHGQVSEKGLYEELIKSAGSFAQFILTYRNEQITLKDSAPDQNVEDIMDILSRTPSEIEANLLRVLSQEESSTYGSPQQGHLVSRQNSSLSQLSHHAHGGLYDKDLVLSRQASQRSTDASFFHDGSSHVILSRSFSHDLAQTQIFADQGERLVEDEQAEVGGVKWYVYMSYFKAMGLPLMALFVFIYACFHGANVGSSIWLSKWTDDPLLNNQSIPGSSSARQERNDYFLGIYGAFGIAQAILVLTFAFGMADRYIVGSRRLHHGMLYNILRCAMAFFDTTPSGRILNRFSKDMDSVDEDVPEKFGMLVDSAFALLGVLAVISYSTPLFLSMIVPMLLLYLITQRVYLRTSRQLKRLESLTRSPIFNFFSETISGASVIRAFRQQERFIKECDRRTDYNQMFYYYSTAANRWLGVYLDMVGNIGLLAAALFAVSQKNSISGGVIGLSISYALELTGTLTWMVRMSSDMETNVVAVERIKEYSDVPTEAEWKTDQCPSSSWPTHGEVKFDNYTTRYRPGLDLVLRGINVHIKPGDKVGIVGRTGAGKSSMTLALFRIIESSGGSIYIDGWNIADMGLHDLRSKITILPQDPIIFSGSLRMNLDPFNNYNDAEVWGALEHAHLKSFVKSLPQHLYHECSEGGSSFSMGQRQLLCLARSLLRKTKLLVLDEATAAVDMETDELIQETIRQQFTDCTILTIAHRLNTIMDYDKILVLDNGHVEEYDAPDVLLRNTDSIFYSMAHNAGLV